MRRKIVFKALVPIAALALAAPVAAAPLDAVAATLRATKTMTADFVQTAGDGKVARGKMLLARPGKIRFEYDKSKLLIIADGTRLSMIDYSVGQVSQWPVGSTPLAALLDPDKDLARVAKIVEDTPELVRVEARDSKHPEYGSIVMVFFKRPEAPGGLALGGWTAHDAQNNLTQVVLSNVRSNVAVGSANFVFRDPRLKTPGRPL
ncbi:outer membrane lipoprotein carrier protein LolA [Sphingosinicellaceae bacterium]|nr:outer membrane lipoprotein carrier protein LolA [Sphingosinicellaceae bacterium]